MSGIKKESSAKALTMKDLLNSKLKVSYVCQDCGKALDSEERGCLHLIQDHGYTIDLSEAEEKYSQLDNYRDPGEEIEGEEEGEKAARQLRALETGPKRRSGPMKNTPRPKVDIMDDVRKEEDILWVM